MYEGIREKMKEQNKNTALKEKAVTNHIRKKRRISKKTTEKLHFYRNEKTL